MRIGLSAHIGVSPEWATVHQVHGSRVVEARAPGEIGDADAIFTTIPELPLAVFTADCAGVVLIGRSGVGVAHAGWRGAAAGVVAALVAKMASAGLEPVAAVIGPTIGPCCFEVGSEVAARFPGRVSSTEWGTTSIDLWGVVTDQLVGLEVTDMRHCTRHEADTFSHRRDGTLKRMAAIGWIPA